MWRRKPLFAWASDPAIRDQVPPTGIVTALECAACASLPLAALEGAPLVRVALGA